ncbi:unnamed protein product, partial [Mesorhabditis belari]|uniref:Uncharacterized protein n=1 Tax=Mesorhabditis belari TaxID=2138241 RepID=A0AAF3EJW7_9BILA
MLNGLYGYFFGGESAQGTEQHYDRDNNNRENEAPNGKDFAEDEDWQLVPSIENVSGRSSPVIVPQPELRDIDTLSLQSNKTATSTKVLRRAEDMRQARAQAIQKLALETALFANAAASLQSNGKTKTSAGANGAQMTTSCLKRASAAAQSDSKGKQRSKKAGKLNSGRNNDRKCNNLN